MPPTFTLKIRTWVSGRSAPADVLFFSALLLVVSMPLSPFLLSIAMWGFVFSAFWQLALDEPKAAPDTRLPAPVRILLRSFRNLFRQPAYAVFLLLLLVPAVSGLWSDDLHYWLERTRVRLPFLVLPWAFANLPPLSERRLRLVLYALVWLMAGLCVGVGVNFLLHQPEIMHAMYQGRPMPVPRNHIRFSLLVATAVLAGVWLWQVGFVWRYARERVLLGILVVFLFGFIHFLAVRSGLVVLYAALLFGGARWVWLTRRWATALGALLLGGVLLWGGIRVLPSLKQKWEYTVYDWQQYRAKEGATYSDSERWISLQTGWFIWQKYPLLGTGAGDLPAETRQVLAQHFPRYEASPKLPHNQFVYLLAGTGLLGACLSLVAFLYPLFSGGRYRFWLLTAFQVMVFTSFIVEYTIETAMGVAWYLFYTLWLMQVAQKKAPGKPDARNS